MMHRRLRAPAVLAALVTSLAAGCSGLNPGLFPFAGGNAASSLPNPYGTILIMFMNQTSVAARATFVLTKDNGGTLTVGLTALPFSPASDLDYRIAAQDCDVTSIRLTNVTYASEAGPIVVPWDRPPLVNGADLFCGNVVAVTFAGDPPNVFINLAKF